MLVGGAFKYVLKVHPEKDDPNWRTYVSSHSNWFVCFLASPVEKYVDKNDARKRCLKLASRVVHLVFRMRPCKPQLIKMAMDLVEKYDKIGWWLTGLQKGDVQNSGWWKFSCSKAGVTSLGFKSLNPTREKSY